MARLVVAAVLVGVALAVPACTRVSEGVPAADETSATTERSPTTESSETTESTETSAPDMPLPGIVTTPAPVGAPCVPAAPPPVRVVAEIPDPGAPKATVGVPDGWSMVGAPGGARIEGPDGMWATVTIAPSSPDPEKAFRTYTDDLTAETTISTVSVLPGELCGYSGQQLMGVLTSTDSSDPVQYEARIVHVPTEAGAFLIAVYVEAPSETPGFDPAAELVTGDFEISLR